MKRIIPVLLLTIATSACKHEQPCVKYTNISATLSTNIDYPEGAVYPVQYFQYPQVSGLKNKTSQDSINKWLKNADLKTLQKSADYSTVKLVNDINPNTFGRIYSYEHVRVYNVTQDFISYGGMVEYAGGAHPSFVLYPATTISIKTLKPLTLSDLLTGDYQRVFKEYIQKNPQLKQYASDGKVTTDEFGSACDDILDSLLLSVDGISATANMIITDSSLTILQTDFRSFGCPEYLRAVLEINVPYSALQQYIKPNGILQKVIKAKY
ncbi:MAG: DUF4163 domain-containing protein [Prevotellaceae bacterium]|jgi:hypothetical protein|nr:DUF4163 domain-containing protein [Prevotellaceae bacterium]